jgi:membrane protein DedA with SNARE-associated domain
MVWNTVLVSAGYTLGENWIEFWKKTDSLHLDIVILAGLGVGLVLYFLYKRRKSGITRSSDSE